MSLDEVTSKLASKLAIIMPCDDSTCCCIPKRSSVISISIINFLGCVLDLVTSRRDCPCGGGRRAVDSAKKLLVSLFQMANLLLLLASIFEKAVLVDVYVWFTLGYVVMGFLVAISEFVVRATCEGGVRSLLILVPEVLFLFVIFRCLPLVDRYRRHLYSTATSHGEE